MGRGWTGLGGSPAAVVMISARPVEVFAAFPDAQWNSVRHSIADTRVVTEWTFTGHQRLGTRPTARRVGTPGPPQSPATNTSPSKRISTPGCWAPPVNPGTWRVR